MRRPDSERSIVWRNLNVTVREWCDPTDFPWDGDEPLEPGTEGFDLRIEVEHETCDGYKFRSGDSLGSCWGYDNAGLLEIFNDQLLPEALAHLENEIRVIAHGRDVESAEKMQRKAEDVLANLATS